MSIFRAHTHAPVCIHGAWAFGIANDSENYPKSAQGTGAISPLNHERWRKYWVCQSSADPNKAHC